jgi:hypothetical protein
MSEVGALLNRLAAATSVIRTRSDDASRSEAHGSERDENVRVLVSRLQKLVDDLEKAIA